MFKHNQQVIILGLYNLRVDGAGRIIKLIENGENKNKYMIDTDAGYIYIEPARIMDANDYWTMKRKERENK